MRLLSFFVASSICASISAAQFVDCPAGRTYRDLRSVTGEVFCEHILPGALSVKDGPSRFWFNPNFEGASGSYSEGRQVGKWKECDRFEHCRQYDYPAIYPEEEQRPAFKSVPPLTYVDGKYVFDFLSCRSTEYMHTDGQNPDLVLNIGPLASGCGVSHNPVDAAGRQLNSDYVCTIPFHLGKRSFDSLDLIDSLPQYCGKEVIKTGPYMSNVDPDHGEGTDQVFIAAYSLGNNGVGIAQARLHFQDRAESRSDRCVARYDPATKSLYLLSDQPGKYLGPIPAGGQDSIWNSRCFLAGCSRAEITADILKVHFAVRFNPATFAGRHNIFLEMVDTEKHASPAPVYGSWTVPSESGAPPSAWPADRSCPVGTPVSPLGVYSASVVNCKDVSGTWSDPETRGAWSLTQAGAVIAGSLTVSDADCGTTTWKVAGQMTNGVATLTANGPSPALDACGKAPATSITATLAPDCKTGQGKVEIKK